MSRTIEITGEELNQLINEEMINVPTASRSVHVCPVSEGSKEKEVLLNYEGYGYRPVKVTIEFEYDETISFSEGDD